MTAQDRRWWSKKRLVAAQLTAEGQSMRQIAQIVGRTTGWVFESAHDPRFIEHVAALKVRIADRLLEQGIASKAERMRRRGMRWELLQQVREERGQDPSMAAVPGGQTGLIVRSYKQMGSGRDVSLVEEFAVDTAALAEERALEKAAAEEMGDLKAVVNVDARQLTVIEVLKLAGGHDANGG